MKPVVTKITKIKDCLKSHDLKVFDYMDSDEFSILKIEEIGLELPHQSHTFRPDFFSLTIVLDADCTYEIGHESYHLKSGSLLLAKPEIFISNHWLDLKHAFNITFSPSFLTKYSHIHINNFSILTNTNAISLKLGKEQVKTMSEICETMYSEALLNSPLKYDKLGNLLVYLLLQIQQFKDDQITGLMCLAIDKENDIINTFLFNMEKNFSDLVLGKTTKIYHTKDYANQQNVDKNYLSKLISSYTGKTINRWIREKTIDDIKYLLKHSNKSLKEISTLYGFNDIAYFYTYFKKYTGLSPHNFRKSMQN